MRRFLLLCILLATTGAVPSSYAVAPGPGFAVTTYAQGFPTGWCCGGIGPIGLAFDRSNRLVVADIADSKLYRFQPGGGNASTAFFANVPGSPAGITFGKDGKLYVARVDGGDIVEINQTTGAIVRIVAVVACPIGLVTDPFSGDVFATTGCGLGRIHRISAPATATPTVSIYISGIPSLDGISVGPDGTFYVASNPSSAYSVTGTHGPATPVATVVASVPGADGTAVGASSDVSKPPFLVVNRNDGIVSQVSLQGPQTFTTVTTNGERGDFVTVGADGCLYATQNAKILRITHSDGTCDLAAPGETPVVTYNGDTAQDYHDIAHLAATLKTKSGTPMANQTLTFLGSGLACGAKTDANGNASCDVRVNVVPDTNTLTVTYAGSAGVYAAARATIDFTVRKEETSITTTSVRSENAHSVTVSATLFEDADVPIASRLVSFDAAGARCTATTNTSGVATCALDIGTTSAATFTASFAGDAYYVPTSAVAELRITQMTGRARAFTAVVAGTPADQGMPDTGEQRGMEPATFEGSAVALPANAGSGLGARVRFETGPDRVTSSAHIAQLTQSISGVSIDVSGARATATATCATTAATTSLTSLNVNGTQIALPPDIPPNTRVVLPDGTVVTLNEQTQATHGILVAAARITSPNGTVLVLSQARAGLDDCP